MSDRDIDDPSTSSEPLADGEKNSAADAGSESPEEGAAAMATAEDAIIDEE
ncbi:hypothetical protein [Microbacterium invictum]|uniref:Uncharacterized protein n=1 Tax=Microbacterium invictum TaxID=515415 RepID=A0ABZ0VG90_9MICO|nr:hypothetical protein [Microbacterium invictum]WQB71205.1 hypothetical protein T9R20_04350 [Microbacterium invictum]